MRLMAIDVGGKRTGLAIGDDEMQIATPLEVVQAGDDAGRLRGIQKQIQAEGPDALVVGLPLGGDGSEGDQAKKMRAFAEWLKSESKLPVYLVDERKSSQAADGRMARSGLTHKQKKARRDALAAAEILQRFFAGGGELLA